MLRQEFKSVDAAIKALRAASDEINTLLDRAAITSCAETMELAAKLATMLYRGYSGEITITPPHYLAFTLESGASFSLDYFEDDEAWGFVVMLRPDPYIDWRSVKLARAWMAGFNQWLGAAPFDYSSEMAEAELYAAQLPVQSSPLREKIRNLVLDELVKERAAQRALAPETWGDGDDDGLLPSDTIAKLRSARLIEEDES